MAAPYYGMIEEVRVMLVDNDKEFVTRMVDLLNSYDYKVMTVGTTLTTMSMLSKGKQQIDVMILNVHSMNQLSFDLLARAVALDIISLVVCDELNEIVAKKAFDEGAYLVLKKPFDEEIIKYLWQFVLRKKIQREKAREGSKKNRGWMNVEDIVNNNIVGASEEQSGEKKSVSNTRERRTKIHEAEIDVVLNEKYKLRRKRGKQGTKENNEGERQGSAINKVVRQKDYAEWTDDLHSKFMEAVEQLGEGRCYPKEILEVMNVPGLTRMQVASHLQKCRRKNWRSLEERKFIRHPSGHGSSSGSHETRSGFRKFGIMPRLQTNVLNLQRNTDQTQRGPEFSFSTLSTNNIFAREESLIQQQLFCPQLQVHPHSLSICNPFNNSFYSMQNNIGGGLQQQQYGSLFEMLRSQRPQGTVIGNTSYRPGLALNSGDHHTQSNYNLDLNMAQGATYSGSRITSGTDIENATANANFQQYVGEPSMSNVVAALYDSDIEESWTSEC